MDHEITDIRLSHAEAHQVQTRMTSMYGEITAVGGIGRTHWTNGRIGRTTGPMGGLEGLLDQWEDWKDYWTNGRIGRTTGPMGDKVGSCVM